MGCACVSTSDKPRNNINNYKTNNITNHTILTNVANLNNERIINCTIEKDNKKINEKMQSNNTIKDLKNNIIKNYYNKEKKDIKIYYKGKLVNDDKKINDIIKDDSEKGSHFDTNNLNLSMISFSISEISNRNNKNNDNISERDYVNLSSSSIMFKNNNKPKKLKTVKKEDNYYKAIIDKLSPICDEHNQKKTYICLECQISLCKNDIDNHIYRFNEHEIISKEALIILNNEVNDIKNELNGDLINLGIKKNNKLNQNNNNEINDEYIQPLEIFKDIKKEINNNEREINEIMDNLKRKYKEINTNFELDFNNQYPNILEYNEKIDNITDEMNNEKPFIDEINFISTYNQCQNLKKLKEKQLNKIEEIRNELKDYKNNLEKFKKNTDRRNKILSREFNKMVNETFIDNLKDEESSIGGSRKSNVLSRGGSFNHSLFGNKPKLNLMTLLSTPKERKNLIQSIESSMKDKNSNSTGLKKIIEEN